MKTKRFTRLFTALVLIILFACEEPETLEIDEIAEISLQTIDVRSSTIDELPKLANKIQVTTSKSGLNWTSKADGESIILDESRILSVKDSIGNITYSIRMYVPDTPYNIFYNVIAKQTTSGEIKEPFIIKYEVDEAYASTYFTSKRQDAPFKGILSTYKISSFEGIDQIYGKDDFEPEPCYSGDASGDGGSGGSGSGGSGGGGTDHDPGATFTYHPVAFASDTVGSVEVGEGSFGTSGTDGTFKKGIAGKNDDDCPEDEMLVPINELAWPFPDCSSFEYANVGNIKGAKIVGVNNTFVSYHTISPTRTEVSVINIFYPSLFFTMPKTWTNGRSATLSANALNRAIDLTQDWFERKPTASELQLQLSFMANMKAQMARYGGTVGTSDQFTVRNPSPYKTSWLKKNCG